MRDQTLRLRLSVGFRGGLSRKRLRGGGVGGGGEASLAQVERACILAALQRHGGNRQAAAQQLGISLRKLYYRLREYEEEG